jgi:hypothetical protein
MIGEINHHTLYYNKIVVIHRIINKDQNHKEIKIKY